MERASKREAILTAAERVFADRGFDAATMRTIAEAAHVGLPLVVYHFETKLKLYRAVFERYQYLNERRQDALARIDLDGPGALEGIVRAILLVAAESDSEPGAADYLTLVLREASDPRAPDRQIIGDLFDPMAREFIRALEHVLPHKPEGFHRWAYLFAIGAYTSTNVGKRERALAGDRPRGDRFGFLTRFVCEGIRNG